MRSSDRFIHGLHWRRSFTVCILRTNMSVSNFTAFPALEWLDKEERMYSTYEESQGFHVISRKHWHWRNEESRWPASEKNSVLCAFHFKKKPRVSNSISEYLGIRTEENYGHGPKLRRLNSRCNISSRTEEHMLDMTSCFGICPRTSIIFRKTHFTLSASLNKFWVAIKDRVRK